MIVVMGVYPRPFLSRMHTAVSDLKARVEARTQPEPRAAAPAGDGLVFQVPAEVRP
jgi:hypothetical protein